MKKNTAGQIVAFQMNSTADGSAVTSGTPTVYYTIDGGTQGTGSGSSTHEGNGQWSYAPAQAETNGDHVAFTMALSSAISQTVNVYPTYPQTGDGYAVLNSGTHGNAALKTLIDTLDTVADGIQTDLDNGTDGLGALKALIDTVDTVVDGIKTVTDALPDSGALNDLATLETRLTAARAAYLDAAISSRSDGTLVTLHADYNAAKTAAQAGDEMALEADAVDAAAIKADAVTEIQSGLATEAKQDTAQTDLDTITGADGVTFATTQGNYAPAKAGDAMALTSGERTTLVASIWSALTSGLATVGSVGKLIVDYLDAAITSRSDGTEVTLHSDYDAAKTAAQAGDEMTLEADAITSAKFDESTAYPIASADTGATRIARVGADGDTLETISDQIDAVPTAEENRIEMDNNSTQLDAIVTDTNELQTDDIPGLIAALNNLSSAEAQTACNSALIALHLDHLLAADYDPASKPGIATALLNELVENDSGVSRFSANTLEEAPTGGSAPTVGEIRTEMDDNSTKLAAIVADTDELQSDDVPGLIAALNNVSSGDVQTACNAALVALHLDHLLSVDYDPASKPGTATALLNELIENDGGIARLTANALEQAPSGSGATAEEVRVEMDDNSTKLDAIVTDTDELQSDDVPGLIAALNNLSSAEAQTACNAALVALHLDHLLAADYDPASKPGIATALLNELIENDGGASRFTENSLEQAPSGTGASAAAISDSIMEELLSDHSAVSGSLAEALSNILVQMAGTGTDWCTVTVTDDDGDPVATATIYITNDSDGGTVVAGPITTNDVGQVRVRLNDGETYYYTARKDGKITVQNTEFSAEADA